MTAAPFVFTVAAKPPRDISPNASRRVMPATKGKVKAAWRRAWHDGILAGLEARQGTPGQVTFPAEAIFTAPVRCEITYIRGLGDQEWDGDNLVAVCKWGLDQLEYLKVVRNDRLLRVGVPRQVAIPRRNVQPRLEVRLFAEGAEDPALARVSGVLRDLIDLCGGPEGDAQVGDPGWFREYRRIVARLHEGDT